MNWLNFFTVADVILWITTLVYSFILMLGSRYANRNQKIIAWGLFALASLIACFIGGLG